MNSYLVLLIILLIILILIYKKPIYYYTIYYMFYNFSGAHNKPTSDSKYDPSVEHQNSYFYKLVRDFEKKEYKKNMANNPNQKNKPLPEIDYKDVNKDLFLKLTKNKTVPIVIRGLIKDTDAIKKWSPHYFRNKYGDTKLLNIKKGNQLKENAYTSFTQKIDASEVSIRDSIDNMLDKNSQSYYINNVTEIFTKHPELVDDLNLNKLKKLDDSINKDNWLKINMFMGGHNTGSSLHCAVGGNFFFNVYGKKKWILIDPKYSKYLKSTPSKDFAFVISGYDIENPTKELKKIPKYEVVLEPGDVLFNAPWWWHYVKNETDFTIGCAIRDHTLYKQSFSNNPMYMWMSNYKWRLNPLFLKFANYVKGYDYLKNKSMESDKDIVDHLTGYKTN